VSDNDDTFRGTKRIVSCKRVCFKAYKK